MIYLDSAATTQIDADVFVEMLPFFKESYGNPGSTHEFGHRSLSAIEKARGQVASMMHCPPENIIFTSGGTESNNTVISGWQSSNRPHIAVSAIEHSSIIRSASKRGNVSTIRAERDGTISLDAVVEAVAPSTGLVSVMLANNETGAVNNVRAISDWCHEHGILLHSDCVQAAGQFDLDVDALGVDMASISAHKIHGPKGVGALYIRDFDALSPLICGGRSQEFGMRGGTQNVPGIVGLGAACGLVSNDFKAGGLGAQSVFELREAYLTRLKQLFYTDDLSRSGIEIIGPGESAHTKVLNLKIDGVSGESMVLAMSASNVAISAGSACNSHETTPSHVLTAMGLSPEDAMSCIRVSFSKFNTMKEVVDAAEVTARSIWVLRAMHDL